MQAIMQVMRVSAQTDFEILESILERKCIKPVYQPIVSLTDGQTFGFEALSRIADNELKMNIEHMFRTADKMNKSWELETLCRTKALENAAHIEKGKKLFLNVNSNIMHDEKFREGFTKSCLNIYGLDSNDVIFEITERVSVTDNNAFLRSIDHYKIQNYGIAIDDVGAGYSGLNIIADVKPDLIKLDMNLIRGIDKDEIKQLLCKAMADFGKGAGIKLIAEGIETEEELKMLIKLNVDFGQGYFLGVPLETFNDMVPEKVKMIQKYHSKHYAENTN